MNTNLKNRVEGQEAQINSTDVDISRHQAPEGVVWKRHERIKVEGQEVWVVSMDAEGVVWKRHKWIKVEDQEVQVVSMDVDNYQHMIGYPDRVPEGIVWKMYEWIDVKCHEVQVICMDVHMFCPMMR